MSFDEIIRWIQSPGSAEQAAEWIRSRLTEWMPWNERQGLPGVDDQGIYFIAKGKPSKGDITSQTIVCIGESHARDRSLLVRLNEYHHAAFENGGGHYAGWRRGQLPDDQRGTPPDFFVAILPLTLSEPWQSVLPHFLEGIAHWKYKTKIGDLPQDNQEPRNANAFGWRSPR